jgi:DNA adenine methylase
MDESLQYLNTNKFELNKSEFQEIILEDLRKRVQRPNSINPRSFLRWAGSKRFALKHILDVLPNQFHIYREPFLGSGALFFLLRPKRAVLSDTCSELVGTFIAIRDNVNAVIDHLRPMKPRKETFYHIRQNRSTDRFKYAAEFIYLNKSCWNGLYRVNSAGIFNVPFGRPKTDFIVDFENLRSCSITLKSPEISLRICDFEESISGSKPGDLVYLDPPYVTGHNDNGFIEYNQVLFSLDDQRRMAKIAKRLVANGVHVIVSNANHHAIIELYSGFAIKHFDRSSTLASDITKRRKVSEVLLFSTS